MDLKLGFKDKGARKRVFDLLLHLQNQRDSPLVVSLSPLYVRYKNLTVNIEVGTKHLTLNPVNEASLSLAILLANTLYRKADLDAPDLIKVLPDTYVF
ncbi:hypothetical protein [Thermus phage P23-45]|uniref:Uncharacterized protein n=2 Tax=Oshimavirus TaxID=1623293 RepID=A7XX80_BP234|nr:hypothetical protein P23p52 [Thermus phage P23-45]YP_001468020.1 hypothetical protein P74p50 [Thermus phage P74-26]ABU96885.1 hypothetical protein P23p52 [Thermus phage P23-45]ABU97000.1 hypothetical protein P74p50 [Thermus phage P74-26]UYB98422.1 hypothetical protein [Thermus phage P23-45]